MPPETPILVFPFLMQRNTALWGEDAEVFDPDRWIDPARLKNITEDPTKFIPFSLGPRVVSRLIHFPINALNEE